MKNTLSFAQAQDAQDELASFRKEFHIPTQANGKPYIYFCGNSLGCQPKKAADFVREELEDWAKLGVEGHFHARHPWMPYHEFLTASSAKIVGALPSEVVVMNSVTTNLHLMMVSFYRPSKQRYKIVIEGDAFPSDKYAVDSQARFHGFEPSDAIIKLRAREGETLLRTEDILETIRQNADSIALVMLGGINYYTGQVYDMKTITAFAQEKGICVGYDLAHAAGNYPVKLHDWGVDFAVWCNYKYINGGPGTVGGCFVHEKHHQNADLPRFAGWWGQDKATRFLMGDDFQPIVGAEGWQLSNAPILLMAALRASLELFDAAGMDRLRAKSEKLTGYLQDLLEDLPSKPFDIISPRDPKERGCQLSLRCKSRGKEIFQTLSDAGVICDWREPDVIRVAPTPLYNTFEEVWQFVEIVKGMG